MSSITYMDLSGTAAENYARYFVPAIGAPVAKGLLRAADIKSGERVLDVGCGTGLIAQRAAEQAGAAGAVTGIDVAMDMIEVASRTPAQGAEIEWRVADAAQMPVPDGVFDVVTCQMSLMLMQDRTAALAEMRRVLRPGGRLVLNTPGRIQPPLALMAEAITDHISADLGGFVRAVFSLHDPQTLAALVREAGFSNVASSEYTATLDLPGPVEFLWQYINLTPMAPFVAQAPSDAQLAMGAQVSRTWAPFVIEGRTPIDQPIVLTTART